MKYAILLLYHGGRILKHTTPTTCTEEVKDQIWTKVIERDELESMESNFNVLSSKYLNKASFGDNPFSECKPIVKRKWWEFWKSKYVEQIKNQGL